MIVVTILISYIQCNFVQYCNLSLKLIMNDDQKQIIRETCKSHSTKVPDREFTHAYPTKLSKRELEDLYYAILDNNLELKQTINTQNDKIKQLSTKVQRLAALQKAGLGKNEKECCINAKTLLREQKDIIAEQKRANDRLSERNRILNMRLCSAKQFLGKNSARCNKCCLAAALKNSSTSALNVSTKRSATNIHTLVSSCDLIQKEPVTTKSIEVQTSLCEKMIGEVCNENKCKTLMEELKQKIAVLEEELSKIHEEYLTRVSRLENDIVGLRQEEVRKRQDLEQSEAQGEQLLQRLRAAETQCDEINLQLSIEQRKVAELETRLRAAELSVQVARTIDHHRTSDKMPPLHAVCESTSLEYHEQMLQPPTQLSNAEDVRPCPSTPKNSDDSGYMEAILQEEQKSPRKEVSSDLREKILELQTQLNSLKRLAAVEKDSEKTLTNFESYDLAIEEDQVSMLRNIDYNNLMKDAPLSLEPLKTGEIFEIKQSDSNVLEARGDETLYENSTEPTTSMQISSFQKSNLNLPAATKGILEKSDDFSKAYKKDEKVGKNVSYDDVISDTDNNTENMKTNPAQTEGEVDSYAMVGYSPSDDKHFVISGQQAAFNVKDNKSIRRQSVAESSPLSRSPDVKEEHAGHYKIDEKKIGQNKTFKYIDSRNKENKYVTKVNKVKKKISIEVPDSDVHLCSKEANIDLSCKVAPCDNASTESSKEIVPSGHTSPKGYPTPVADKDGIKVIKEVRSNSDINMTKPEHRTHSKENLSVSNEVHIKKSKPKKNREFIESHIDKFRKKDGKKLDICEHHTVVCTCPRAARREVRVFRTCSGTSRFATVAHADAGLRQCACLQNKHQHSGPGPSCGTQTHKFRESGDGGTYVLRAEAAVQLCASPADTDGEISGLTDLPDEVSPRNALSAGEEHPTTCTDTFTPTTECVSLSEGEMPLRAPGRKPLSPGERRRKTSSGEMSPPLSTSQRVEEALQAIGEELARCRVLLQHQRPQAKCSKDMASMTDGTSDAIALRKAEGQARIVAAHAHICHFTLHIGTLVLSDQAVLHSRGKSLMLTWRFYDQSAGLARVSPGRVAHFDLTTEYQLPFTEHFLEYLRNEDMCLKICELDKGEEVFASCALPLRDTLLHANRRADMSLPLVAGTEILSSRVVTDALDSGEEAGVLDVWCLLRLDPALLIALRKGSSKAATAYGAQASEDQSSVYHLTHELEANMQRNSKTNKPVSEYTSNNTLIVRSSQDVRQAVANEIRPPSKLRVLVSDVSDSNTIYSLLKTKNWRAGSPKSSDGHGQKKSVTIGLDRDQLEVSKVPTRERSSIVTNLGPEDQVRNQTLNVTVVWLALSEDCEAMANPDVQRLFVAYSFLGRDGADLETPVSLPKPKSYNDKCYFNFSKQFLLNDCDLPLLGHMAKCRRRDSAAPSHTDCVTFAVVSEPPEDPLGLDTCEDIGFAHLYLGDVLSRCEDSDSYTEVLSVRARTGAVCGVLAVRLAGLHVLRRLW